MLCNVFLRYVNYGSSKLVSRGQFKVAYNESAAPPGNVIEWRYPPEVNLEGVEFKSIASGLHNVAKDFM